MLQERLDLLVPSDSRVTLGPRGRLVHKDLLEIPEPLERPVQEEALDPWGPRVRLVPSDLREVLVLKELSVILEILDHKAEQDSKASVACLVSKKSDSYIFRL